MPVALRDFVRGSGAGLVQGLRLVGLVACSEGGRLGRGWCVGCYRGWLAGWVAGCELGGPGGGVTMSPKLVTSSVYLVTLRSRWSASVGGWRSSGTSAEGSGVSTRTRGGLLLPIVIVGGLLVVFGGSTVYDAVTGIFGNVVGGTTTIGAGDSQVMISGDAESASKQCTAQQMVSTRQCGDLIVLIVDAARMPFIARNTKLAWESSRPSILTMNRGKQVANRAAACPRTFPKPHGGSCDEYPMAATDEGGKNARTEEVPVRENNCQGGSYGRQYPKDGDNFLVIITHPDLIAPGPFTGTDIAKEQGLC